jgi:hypothetical protein
VYRVAAAATPYEPRSGAGVTKLPFPSFNNFNYLHAYLSAYGAWLPTLFGVFLYLLERNSV